MIANIGRGENLMGALLYNQLKVDKENGQILYTHKMIETLDGQYSVPQLMRSFEIYLLANIKTEKPVLHISLNPDPKDQVSDEKFEAIAQDYMEQMGYGNQPYIVFKHTDIDRTHIHIVSVCIDEEGKKISDTFDKRRSVAISRALEQKYNLIPVVEKENHQRRNNFRPVDYKAGDIKSQIASILRYLPKLYRFQSLGEYNALLSLFNITAEEVKGELRGVQKKGLIYFAINENGEKISHPFKASSFGKQAGYVMLQEHFEKSKESLHIDASTTLLKNTIELAKHTTSNEKSFKSYLVDHGINTMVRRNSEGRIYGITFIDHKSKTVSNGSRFGKHLSANVFNEWWNNNNKPIIQNTEEFKEGTNPISTAEALNNNPHNLFDFISKNNEDGILEGFGGLLPEALGEDYEEHLFESLIKKKKKRMPKS